MSKLTYLLKCILSLNRWQQLLINSFVGYDTILMNSLLSSPGHGEDSLLMKNFLVPLLLLMKDFSCSSCIFC